MSLCWTFAPLKSVPAPQSLAAVPARGVSQFQYLPCAHVGRASALAFGVVASRAMTAKKVRSGRSLKARDASAEAPSDGVEKTIAEAVLRSSQPLFDPLGLCQNEETYKTARDLEMIMGRYAMLAAVGYPTAEIFHQQIAEVVGMPVQLTAAGQAPHFLNGGSINPVVDVVVFISLAGMFALLGEISAQRANGNTESDSLNPKGMRLNPMMSPTLRYLLSEAQRVNGRVAMAAIVCIVAVEAYSGKAVVDVSPFLFGAK